MHPISWFFSFLHNKYILYIREKNRTFKQKSISYFVFMPNQEWLLQAKTGRLMMAILRSANHAQHSMSENETTKGSFPTKIGISSAEKSLCSSGYAAEIRFDYLAWHWRGLTTINSNLITTTVLEAKISPKTFNCNILWIFILP